MKTVIPLSDKRIRAAQPPMDGKQYNALFDGGGLYLAVMKNGSKLWRIKYRFMGKPDTISLGIYPDVSLSSARASRERIKREIAEGIDPGVKKKAEKAAGKGSEAGDFKTLSLEWFERMTAAMVPGHRKRIIDRLEGDVFPYLGKLNPSEITPPQVLSTVRRIEGRGAVETARRALGNISSIFRYGVATGRVVSDPCRDLRGALPPPKERHFSAITDPARLGVLLRGIEGYHGGLIVRAALRVAPMLIVRPGELRKAEWKDVDLEAGEWRFLITKTKTPHIVPLARQAVEILRELHQKTGEGRFVFPNPRTPDGSRPMSENAVLAAIRNLGFGPDEATGHGFRSTARTMLDEVLHFRLDLIEAQLGHSVADPLGRAYNRTTFLTERREMMQAWADYLDKIRDGTRAPVIETTAA